MKTSNYFEKDGLIVLDKPSGLSSFLAVNIVKRAVGAKKAGHMGTLDPLASGVLVIGINKATKLFDKFLKSNKEYYAEYEFGYETDTLDLEGKVIKKDENFSGITKEEFIKVLPKFVGKMKQMPPVYSAKKIDGKKACDLAREGKEITLEPKEVEVFALDFVDEIRPNVFGVKIQCSSGFYVRALGRDIAKELGSFATTVCIRRTKCCGFDIAQADKLEDIKQGKFNLVEIENA